MRSFKSSRSFRYLDSFCVGEGREETENVVVADNHPGSTTEKEKNIALLKG